jgi:hypothetical protein
VDDGLEGAVSVEALKKQLVTLERRMADAMKLPPKPKSGKGRVASDAPTVAATATAATTTPTLARKSSFGWQVRSYRCGPPARVCPEKRTRNTPGESITAFAVEAIER